MKKTFTLYLIKNTEVCVKSSDYYARGGDFELSDIMTLQEIESFSTEEGALEHISNIGI